MDYLGPGDENSIQGSKKTVGTTDSLRAPPHPPAPAVCRSQRLATGRPETLHPNSVVLIALPEWASQCLHGVSPCPSLGRRADWPKGRQPVTPPLTVATAIPTTHVLPSRLPSTISCSHSPRPGEEGGGGSTMEGWESTHTFYM